MSASIQKVSRRGFLRGMFSAGALLLGARVLPQDALAALEGTTFQPNIWLGLETDGTLHIVAHRSEMGTGSRTALPLVVADEMEADFARVKLEQAIGDKKYGDQNTDGSRSIRYGLEVMHEAGATARLMLERAAAQKWGVDAGECHAKMHQVVHSSGKTLGFGELAEAAAKLPVPDKSELKFKPKSEYRYIGKSQPIYDMKDLVSGGGTFGMDAKMDGMVYASVEHPPVLGGKVKSFDDSEAKKVPGVIATVELPAFKPPHGFQSLGGVAVIAKNTWAAFQGRKKLQIEWDLGPNASYTSANFKQYLTETAKKPGKEIRNVGDVEKGFGEAAKIIEAEYYVPHLAHAPMEPPAAVASYENGSVTLWATTQNPQAVQQAVAPALGIEEPKVVCHVTLLGGGFGRKSKPDYCVEAALLSKELGKPVKVVWSREDDIRFDYFHAVSAMYMKAGVDKKGRPTAWLQRSVFTPIGSTFAVGTEYGSSGEMGMGFSDTPYAFANHRVENGPAPAHIRIGWMRSVANIYHAFAVCSFTDELAHAAGKDPKQYLLDLIGKPRKIDLKAEGVDYANMGGSFEEYPLDTGRLRHVIETVAKASNWDKRKSGSNKGFGIAAHRSFLSYIATVVEVDIDEKGKVKIPNVWTAVDVGQIVHRERVLGQFEGGNVFGTSLALLGEITASDGRVDQSNFHDYPVARIQQAPVKSHVTIVDSEAPPAGVGEPGVPPFAPALCNAIFAATGKRYRELPLSKFKLA
ncbi:MAG: molybdopterin-dependent oxidoreductase [Acidobacteria bacterium]|nr:molybdopterin-dependent oxidoreductase [Acidobacteriota bacterium]